MLSWIISHGLGIFNAATAIVFAASTVCALTKTPKDDVFVGKLYKVLELIAVNVGKAKQLPGEDKAARPAPRRGTHLAALILSGAVCLGAAGGCSYLQSYDASSATNLPSSCFDADGAQCTGTLVYLLGITNVSTVETNLLTAVQSFVDDGTVSAAEVRQVCENFATLFSTGSTYSNALTVLESYCTNTTIRKVLAGIGLSNALELLQEKTGTITDCDREFLAEVVASIGAGVTEAEE